MAHLLRITGRGSHQRGIAVSVTSVFFVVVAFHICSATSFAAAPATTPKVETPTDATDRISTTRIFESRESEIRWQEVVVTGDTLHLWVLSVGSGGTPQLRYSRSTDSAKTWTSTAAVNVKLDERTAWVRVFPRSSNFLLLTGTDPGLGPQTPRIANFMGTKLEGIPGFIQVAQLGADGISGEPPQSFRIDNQGTTIHSHRVHPFSCQLLEGKGESAHLFCSSWFPGARSTISMVFGMSSADRGQHWSAPKFIREEFPMVPLLKPPLFISAEGVDVFWGDGQARKLGRLHSADGQSWQVGDPGNVNEVNGLTATYSSFQVGKTWIIADQQELAAKKNFFGVTELESDDEGRTWRTARVVDLSMEKPYALFGTGDGEARGYLVYALGLAAATFDGGRHWVKATFPRELSSGAYTISPKLGFLVSSHEQLPDKSWVVRLARLAPS